MTTISLRIGVISVVAVSVWSGALRPRPVVSSQNVSVSPPAFVQPRTSASAPPDERRFPLRAERQTIADLQRRGTLTVLLPHNVASYFLYRGEQMGFEYELARAFAKELGIELEVLTPPPGMELTAWFMSGKGDVIAGLAVPDDYRPGALKVSLPYLDTTAQILTPSDNPDQRDFGEIVGKPLAVQPDAPYARQLLAVTDGAWSPPTLLPVCGDDSLGEAVRMMIRSEVTASLLTAPQAQLVRRMHPGKLRTAGTLPGSVHMVWAVRPQQTELLTALNAYLARISRSGELKILFEKYFVTADHLRDSTRTPEFTLISKRLSRYDRLIARHAEKAGFDWRLIAALIFEESRFIHERTSGAGAYGLMQVTPGAAQDTKVKDYTRPHSNIAAGIKYLQMLARQFPYGRPEDQLALVLASYVMGLGHVEDAQRLASVLGYDSHCWEDSMEQVFPLLENPTYARQTLYGMAQGREAVRYVNAIRKRYRLYSQHVARQLVPVNGRTAAPRQAASAAG